MRTRILVVALVVAAAVAAVAAAAPARKASALVKLRKTPLGRILVDGRGRTLYLFEADRGRRSVCYAQCAVAWPPLLTTGMPRAGKGVRAKLLGTTKRKGGGLQVTYRGHPLYLFVQDTRPGQTAGQGLNGFGGLWYVLSASGRMIDREAGTAAPPATTTTTTTSGGYGSGGYP